VLIALMVDPGARIKSWTDLHVKAETFSVFDGAERDKGDIGPLFVVPSDVNPMERRPRLRCLSEQRVGGSYPFTSTGSILLAIGR